MIIFEVVEKLTLCLLLIVFKVWDAVTGSRTYSFEGHDAPVYSLCPHAKENIHVRASLDNTHY